MAEPKFKYWTGDKEGQQFKGIPIAFHDAEHGGGIHFQANKDKQGVTVELSWHDEEGPSLRVWYSKHEGDNSFTKDYMGTIWLDQELIFEKLG